MDHPVGIYAESPDAKEGQLPQVHEAYVWPQVYNPDDLPEAVNPPQAEVLPQQPPIRPSFVKRHWKWLVAIAVLVVVIITGAVTGGILGSRDAVRNSAATAGGTPTATSSASSTSVLTSSTPSSVAFPGAMTGTAASVNIVNNFPTIQLIYQKNTSEIFYRLYLTGTSFESERQLKLSLPPQLGAALSLCSRTDSQGNSLLSLFYTYKSGNRTDIVMSGITCAQGSASCSETLSNNLTSTTTHAVHAQSKLSSLWLGGQFPFRVFYQGEDGQIVQLADDGKEISTVVSYTTLAFAVPGSTIAAAFGTGPGMSISYLAAGSGVPTETVWQWNGNEQSPIVIDQSSNGPWDSNAQMVACYEPIPDIYNLFYVLPSTKMITGYTRSGSASGWTPYGTSSQWPSVDGTIAAIAYWDQIRLYYMSGGVMEQPLLGNGTWYPAQAMP